MPEAGDASILSSNLTAVEAISAKLAEVTRLAEKLDARLCEAGARTRPVAVTSSTSSLLSATSSSGISARTTSSLPIAPASTIMTTSSVSATAQIRSMSSNEVAPAAVKSDVAKSDITTTKKFDDASLRISSHSVMPVEISNTDSSKEMPLNKVRDNERI